MFAMFGIHDQSVKLIMDGSMEEISKSCSLGASPKHDGKIIHPSKG